MNQHLYSALAPPPRGRETPTSTSPTFAKPAAKPVVGATTRVSAVCALVVLAASLFGAASAKGAPGDLDSTFSDDGRQLTSIATSEAVNDMVLQADGRIVVVGESYDRAAGTYGSSLTRFNPDGSLDLSFDRDGRVMTAFGNVAGTVALQPDRADAKIDKIVAVGGQMVARYLPDGSPDNSFGVNGRVSTDFGISDVQVQPDDRIVVAGYGGALARFNVDGSLDTSFGGTGKVAAGFNTSSIALQRQADGPDKIVVGGSTPESDGNGDLALARYNADGSLDKSFGVEGKQTISMWGSYEGLGDVAIGPDGTIAAVGASYCFTFWSTMLVLAVFGRDGSTQGLQLTDAGGLDSGSGVAIQSDGKIVAVGGSAEDFLVARYDSGGNPDASFHDDGVYTNVGVRTTDFGGSDGASGVALQPDGKIVAAGTSYTYAADGSATGRIALARYEGGSVPGTAPVNSTAPTIRGSAIDGQTLTANPGAWSGSAAMSRGYQWRRCDSTGANCLDITGASETTYVLVTADVGHAIRVREMASNAFGGDSAESAATGMIAGTLPATSTPSTISGSPTQGQTLAVAKPGAWSGSAPMSRGYQWRRCDSTAVNCVDIVGASAPTYLLVTADVGHAIRVRETATNAYGQSSVDSAATAAVKPIPGSIVWKVTNTKNVAIAGATVNCGSAGTATTNTSGYSIAAVRPGIYTCTATATSYGTRSLTVTVSSGNPTTAGFSLARK
jgi:uncharacterized delta-60 repeat protein